MGALRVAGSAAVIVIVAVMMQACDFSSLLGAGGNEGSSSSGGGDDEASGPVITSYVLRASDNPELAFDAVGTISATEVRLVLPYSVVNGDVLMDPTVAVSGGASYVPQGAQSFKDPVFYTVTADDGSVAGYSVYADIDPTTLP